MAYADTTMRVIAYIIDSIILGIAIALVAIILGAIAFGIAVNGGFFIGVIIAVVIAIIALLGSAFYFVYFWQNLRASPGQKMLGLETVNAADGATLTRDQAVRRWAFLFGPQVIASVFSFSGSVSNSLGALGSLLGLLAFLYAIYLLYTVTQSSSARVSMTSRPRRWSSSAADPDRFDITTGPATPPVSIQGSKSSVRTCVDGTPRAGAGRRPPRAGSTAARRSRPAARRRAAAGARPPR